MVTKSLKPDHGPVPDVVDPDEHPGVQIHYMSKEEGIAYFHREAMTTLGISGDEFLQRWDAGEWQPVPDDTEGRRIAELSMMIPFARVVRS